MKKILLVVFSVTSILLPALVKSQSFTTLKDTVFFTINNNVGTPFTNVKNLTGSNLNITWKVIGTNFAHDWLADTAFGICDNFLCRGNNNDTLWNDGTNIGHPFTSLYGANSTHDSLGAISLQLNLSGVTTFGSKYVTINMMEGTTSKNVTFMINKIPTAVPTVTANYDNISLYPNPASNAVNLVYDANADVKNIAIYNIIGKMVNVYKVSGNSANLNLENVPSGIYFVKLYNSKGNVVVTRKFTKQ